MNYLDKIIIAVLAFCLTSLPCYADPKDDNSDAEPVDQKQTDINMGNGSEKETQTKVNTPETFTPSEDISEDLSVSFPIDI